MAIVNMTKFSLFTFDKEQDALLKELQKFNYVHFLKPEEVETDANGEQEGAKTGKVPEKVVAVNEQVEKVKYALKLLFNYDERPGGLKGLREGNPTIGFDQLESTVKASGWEATYDAVRQISDRLDELKLKETKMRSELEEVTSWTQLDISPKRIEAVRSARTLLGAIPRKMEEGMRQELNKLKYTYVEKVGESKADFYYLIITHPLEEEAVAEILRQAAFSQHKLDYDEEPLKRKQRLNKEIIELKAREHETRDELRAYGQDIPKLEMAYEYLENKRLRVMANENFINTETMNAMEGYIPTEKAKEFEEAIHRAVKDRYHLSAEPADREDETVPIILKNNKFASAFSNITQMYSMPQYNEIDPTPLLAPFYMFFFGMMLADACYGLILLIGSSLALKYLNLSKSMRNFVQFFFYLSIPTIFWGVIYGSYFSLDIPVPKLLDTNKDFQLMLIISIIFGLVHLFFGLAIKAYMLLRDGKKKDMVYDVVFWYMALTGMILLLLAGPAKLPSIVGTVALWVMVIGMAGIVLFAARDAAGWGGRIAGGLYSLYGISSWVGDFVSYSRLMALGLSGAFIGMAFNMIAGMIGSAWYLLPFAALIFLVGHGFNLFLSALGAYVHSLRLIYVEFFGKFYSGGGKAFKKLKRDPKYINYSDVESYD